MQERLDHDFYSLGLEPKPLKRKWATDDSSLHFSPPQQLQKQLKLQNNPYNAFETNNIFAQNVLNQVEINQQQTNNTDIDRHYFHLVKNGGKCTAIYCTGIEGMKGIQKAEVLIGTYEHFASIHNIKLEVESDQDILTEINEKHKVISFISREIKKAEFEIVYARKKVFLKNPTILQKHLKELQDFMKSEEKKFFCPTCAKSQTYRNLNNFIELSKSKGKEIPNNNKSDYTPVLLANRLNRNELENYFLRSKSQCKCIEQHEQQQQQQQQFESPLKRSQSTIKFKDNQMESPKSAKFLALRHQDSAELYLNLQQKLKDKSEDTKDDIQVNLASQTNKYLNSFSLKKNNEVQEEFESDRDSSRCLFHKKVLDSYSINKNRLSHQRTSQSKDSNSEKKVDKQSLFLNSILTDNTNTVLGKQPSVIESPFFNLNKFSLFKESVQKQFSVKQSAQKSENSDYCVLCQAISVLGKNSESQKKNIKDVAVIEQVMEPD